MQIKKDPYVLAFYSIVVLAAAFLIYKGSVTWAQVGTLAMALIAPSPFGRNQTTTPSDTDPPKGSP